MEKDAASTKVTLMSNLMEGSKQNGETHFAASPGGRLKNRSSLAEQSVCCFIPWIATGHDASHLQVAYVEHDIIDEWRAFTSAERTGEGCQRRIRLLGLSDSARGTRRWNDWRNLLTLLPLWTLPFIILSAARLASTEAVLVGVECTFRRPFVRHEKFVSRTKSSHEFVL